MRTIDKEVKDKVEEIKELLQDIEYLVEDETEKILIVKKLLNEIKKIA